MDPRYAQLAQLMAGHATGIKAGDRVLFITYTSVDPKMNEAVIEAVRQAGGSVLEPLLRDQRLIAAALRTTSEDSLETDGAQYLYRLQGATKRIEIRGYLNPNEAGRASMEDHQRFARSSQVQWGDHFADGMGWVLTNWPSAGFAQLMGVSTPEAEEMYFKAVLADYPAMERSVQPLKELMDRTDQVMIHGPSRKGGYWNLRFSIKGIGGVPCVGHRNIPDGEVYTAPVRNSMNGMVEYNTLTITKSGERFEGVYFKVREGKIYESGCEVGDPHRIEQILDTDEGARYFGEWSLGLNWGIQRIIGDTLFDEKVGGTFHLTPGKAYKDANNGNKSGVHWDIVCDQREPAGGGEICFDGKIIRKNGIFVLPELAGLNPAGTQGALTLADQPPHTLAI